jgi:hypothetical protein
LKERLAKVFVFADVGNFLIAILVDATPPAFYF